MLSKIAFKPGIVRDDTALANEGGWIDSDRIRFVRGNPQTLGGWQLKSTTPLGGIARAAHDWADLTGTPYLAWGTATSLFALTGGATIDITPPLAEGVLVDPFATVSGSAVVTVRHPAHGLATGDSIVLANATPTGGLTLNGTYTATVVNADSYTITAGGAATSTATSGATGTVDYRAPLPAGNVDGVVSGYGTGGYGEGAYGGALAGDSAPRIWSLDNFGENLLANPRGRGLYEWQPSFQAPELVTNGDFSSSEGWTTDSGWTVAAGVATKTAGTANNLSRTVSLVAGRVYRLTVTVAVTAGTVAFKMTAGIPTPSLASVGTASLAITRSGTYSRLFRCPVGPGAIAFVSDAAFAGTIDAVSIKLEAAAYRVEGAPTRIDYMFVDPARFVIALATQEAAGDFSPMLARWSDQENNASWAPDTNNLAGELPLSTGSRVLSGLVTRTQNLLWTDAALYSLTLTGTTDVFSMQLLGTGCGLIGRNAAAEHNGTAYWMAKSGFYAFQGSAPQKIDCPLERDVFGNIASLQEEKIFAGINSQFNEVWWLYPDSRDGVECSRVVVYNFAENHWATHTLNRTAWIAPKLFDRPVAFSADGYLYEHEIGNTANGAPLNWHLTSGSFDIEDGNNLMIVKAIVPDLEDQQGSVAFDLTPRLYPNGPILPTTSHMAATSTDALRMRRKGRQMTIQIHSEDAPSFFRLGALRIDVEKAGAQR